MCAKSESLKVVTNRTHSPLMARAERFSTSRRQRVVWRGFRGESAEGQEVWMSGGAGGWLSVGQTEGRGRDSEGPLPPERFHGDAEARDRKEG